MQNLVICNGIVHTESTTAHQVSKDTDVPTHGTDVPSHSKVLYTDTVMKNGTENLLQDKKIDSAVFIDLTSADTDVEDIIHNAETTGEIQYVLKIKVFVRSVSEPEISFPHFSSMSSMSVYRYGSDTQKIIS